MSFPGTVIVQNKINITVFTSLVAVFFLLPIGNVAIAAPAEEKRDAFYAEKFEKFSAAFEKHVQHLDKCIAEMKTFENEGAELSFNGTECSRLDEMRAAERELYTDARALLEEYIGWIDSLTEHTFDKLVERSSSSHNTLLAAMGNYLSKQKEALDQSERVMEKLMRRLREMEQRVEEAERQIESRQGDKGSPESNGAY